MLSPPVLDRRLVLGALLAFAAVALLQLWLRSRASRGSGREIHKRGALVQARGRPRRPQHRLVARALHPLMLGDTRLDPCDEAKHFKLIGTTGTGKSTAIRQLLGAALARGDRAVVADPDASYHARFYDRYRGDVILNPFELHGAQWDPFLEIRSDYDADELANALIATSEDPAGREWRGYARTLLAALLRRCHARGARGCAELWRLLAICPVEELRPLVANTPAQTFLEPENIRMFCSIRSVLSSAIGALQHVRGQRSAGFSVRNWVVTGRGALFIPYRANQIAALRSIIASWIRLAVFEALSRPEGVDQRLWFVIDELDALGAIDGLKDALARLRKFGGRCVLGFQSVAQVSATYGTGDAQTLVENCGNTLILRCAGSEHGGTAQFASHLIGEREIRRRQTSRGRDREGPWSARSLRRSFQESELQTTEIAVMASELEQLPDLVGYLKTASSRRWVRICLEPSRWPWRSIGST